MCHGSYHVPYQTFTRWGSFDAILRRNSVLGTNILSMYVIMHSLHASSPICEIFVIAPPDSQNILSYSWKFVGV